MRAPIFSEVAHLTADQCNILLPVRGPYERQLLLDHVIHLVHLKRAVRVNLDGCAWEVSQPVDGDCANCGRPLGQIEAKTAPGAASLCGECAFTGRESRLPPKRQWKARRAPACRAATPRHRTRPDSRLGA